MPKIRDLAINTIPSDSPADAGADASRLWKYWMQQIRPPGEPKPPQCNPSPPPKPKPYSGVPDEDVVQMKQQLQQRVRRHIHT